MAKLSDLVSGLGPAPMQEDEMEETEVVFALPSGFRLPDDARGKKEFEQVVSLMDLGDGRVKLTKLGGIPLGEMEGDSYEEEEVSEEEIANEEQGSSSEAPKSLSDAIAQERSMRGV